MVVLNLVLGVFVVFAIDVLMTVKHILSEPIVLAPNLPSDVVGILLLDLLDIFVFVKLSESFILHYCFENTFHYVADTFYRAHFYEKSVILTPLIVLVKYHKASPLWNFLNDFLQLRHLHSFWLDDALLQTAGLDIIKVVFAQIQALVMLFHLLFRDWFVLKDRHQKMLKLNFNREAFWALNSYLHFLVVLANLVEKVHDLRNWVLLSNNIVHDTLNFRVLFFLFWKLLDLRLLNRAIFWLHFLLGSVSE